MDQTGRLSLPFVLPSQEQKHVTLNEALRRIDMLVQTTAKSIAVAMQPDEPETGDTYLVPEGVSGTRLAWIASPRNRELCRRWLAIHHTARCMAVLRGRHGPPRDFRRRRLIG